MLLLWFGIGYTFYSTALGVLGALASRMEEASNASSPVSIVASLSYVFALLVAIQNPDGVAARIATFLPPVSPMIVPLRVALGAIEPWEIVLAVVDQPRDDLAAARVRRAGLLRGGAPDRRPDEAPRRLAGLAAVARSSRSGRSSSVSKRAGVPPACQNTTGPSDAAVAGAGDQPGERLRRVDRVDEDALGPGEEARPRRRPRACGSRSAAPRSSSLSSISDGIDA